MRSCAPGDLVVDGRFTLECIPRLVDVGQLHRWAQNEMPGVRLVLSCDHPEQGGLTGPVGTDHPYDPTRWKEKREPVDEETIAIPFAQILGLDYLITQSGACRDSDLEVVSLALGRFGLGHQVVVSVDPSLSLALSGPR